MWNRARTDSVLVTDVLHVRSPWPGSKPVPGKMSSVHASVHVSASFVPFENVLRVLSFFPF